MTTSTLNQEQQQVFDAINFDNPVRANLLTAKGGCGKSYTSSAVIQDKLDRGYAVTIIAPSHTAKSVIARTLTDFNNGDQTWGGRSEQALLLTVASALGKRPDMTKKPKSYNATEYVLDPELARITENKLDVQKGLNLLVIDEISMVDREDLKAILSPWFNSKNSLILMVGDFRQIPPVNGVSGENMLNKLFGQGRLNKHHLTINMRSAADTQIPEFSDLVYETDGDIINQDNVDFRGVNIFRNRAEFDQKFKDTVNGTDTCTAIAYKNSVVNDYMGLAGNSEKVDLKAGDIVRLHDSISVNYQNDRGKWITEVLANNGDLVTVKHCDKILNRMYYKHPLSTAEDVSILYYNVTLNLPYNGNCYPTKRIPAFIGDSINTRKGAFGEMFTSILKNVVQISDELDEVDNVEDSETYKELIIDNPEFNNFDSGFQRIVSRYGSNMKQVKNLLWGRLFYGERSSFANLTKMYSLTAHKSQGQSIDVVFADIKDIAKARANQATKTSLKYVACSRAKKELNILV